MNLPAAIAKTACHKAGQPGRPKDPGKGVAILAAAKKLFIEQGFEGVSMDQIAAEAGVSKLTVYSHFGDKETLFVTAAKAYCEQQLPTSMISECGELPLRECLTRIAQAFLAMVMSPDTVAGHRILCTPQMAATDMPGLFWESGPRRVQDAFSELLQRRTAAGELEIDDIPRAASQFFTLLKGEPHAQLVFGCGQACKDLDAHMTASVDMFLRAYARR